MNEQFHKVGNAKSRSELEETLNKAAQDGWMLHSFVAHRSIVYDWLQEFTYVLTKARV